MVLSEFSLDSKVAVINGSNEIAKESALALAEAGADIVTTAQAGLASQITREVEQLGRKVLSMPGEVTTISQAETVVKEVLSKFGKIDILVNAARLEFVKPFLEMTQEDWQRVMEINLGSAFACSKAMGEVMVRQRRGRIINITSGLAARGLASCAAYCTSMGGISQLTRALAMEWVQHNVRVNAIATGWFSDGLPSKDEASEASLVRYIPLRRRGQPGDIDALVVYLASDACDWVTGQTFFVAGGLLARG